MIHCSLEPCRERRRVSFGRAKSDRNTPRTAARSPVFIVYKHVVSPTYYDFRLEIDGVLKSWAVPEGPSTEPQESRLAVEAADQPLDYADFRGIVPELESADGALIVWDIGVYDNTGRAGDCPITGSLSKSWEGGHLMVLLRGEKLSGRYVLTHFLTEDSRRRWLLTRMDDKQVHSPSQSAEQ